MKSFVSCALPLCLVLLLGACQTAPQPTQVPVDDLVSAFRQLDQSLAAGQLDSAREQLAGLQQRASGDTRLEQYQRQLAEAHLQQGRQALQAGELERAGVALSQARSLLPQAPALVGGLEAALAEARAQQARAAEAERQAAEQAAAAAEALRLEQARQLRQAAERQAAAIQATRLPHAPAEPAPGPASTARSRVLDPAAARTVVSIAMLDNQDNERLRSLLDQVAADVVAFDCAVRIEVREAKDFVWVASLLNARIKRLDPAYNARLSQVLMPQQAPQLVLSPRR